jgi:hypothetical protein
LVQQSDGTAPRSALEIPVHSNNQFTRLYEELIVVLAGEACVRGCRTDVSDAEYAAHAFALKARGRKRKTVQDRARIAQSHPRPPWVDCEQAIAILGDDLAK